MRYFWCNTDIQGRLARRPQLDASAIPAITHPEKRDPMPTLSGRTALVTGGARGIGYAIAAEFARRGCRVAIADRNEDAALTAVSALPGKGCAFPLDVSDYVAFTQTLRHVADHFGPADILVNSAGIIPSGRFTEQNASLTAAAVNVNLLGVMNGCRAALPLMLRRGSGRIVNVASATALRPLAGLAAYSATKSAVLSFSGALRKEVRRSGVHVQVVLPYMTNTPAGAGLPPARGFRPVEPARVATAVTGLLGGHRFSTCVPRAMGPALTGLSLLPLWLQDFIDGAMRCDTIGLDASRRLRAAYEEELATQGRPAVTEDLGRTGIPDENGSPIQACPREPSVRRGLSGSD